MKIAFKMRLKPGCEEEYQRRHDRIWPELADTLKRAGVSDYSIFLDAETLTLFAVQQLSADHTADQLPQTEIVRRWWNYMADLMAVEADNTPVCVPLRQVFLLD
jgi:L-rhamnose mutarotase